MCAIILFLISVLFSSNAYTFTYRLPVATRTH